jgi:hypothetical protein
VILKQSAEAIWVPELYGEFGAAGQSTLRHDWLSPTEVLPLEQLEAENATLRKLVVDLRLHKEMLQDLILRKL